MEGKRYQLARIRYNQVIELWGELCVQHKNLYEITCNEYLYLLDGEIDQLESTISDKDRIINLINILEEERAKIIAQIENDFALSSGTIRKSINLINFFKSELSLSDESELEKYNLLLIEIIEEIQFQNKKNRIFLNKALFSIKQIQKDFAGQSNVETYNSSGERKLGLG